MKDEAKTPKRSDFTADFTTTHGIDTDEELQYLREHPEELEKLQKSRKDYEKDRVEEFDSHSDLLE